MASRESQGLQIALILLVMLTLLLAVTTFLYYRKSEERGKELAEAKASELAAKTTFDLAFYKMTALRQMLGAADDQGKAITEVDVKSLAQAVSSEKLQEDKGFTAIQDDFQRDMAMYGQGLKPEELNYKILPRRLGDRLRQANQDLAAAAEAQKKLIQDKIAFEKQEGDRAKAALDAQQKAAADLDAMKKVFSDEKNRIDKEKDELAARVATSDDRVKEVRASYDENLKRVSQENTNLKNTTQILTTRLGEANKAKGETTENFERPYGSIAWVNLRERMVWVNLGTADKLRPQVTLSVYDKGATKVAQGDSKGSIEVLRVIEPHLAEARIVDDQVSNPILPGDVLHTPAWRPGRAVHFALAGVLDVTDDGKSDRELVVNLIHRNGGEIDAELKDDGTIQGQLTSETRYLLQGIKPTDTADAAKVNSWTQFLSEAQSLGVEMISLDEFLSYMGWKGEIRTIRLGKGASPEDFMKSEAADKAGSASGGEPAFRERRPPARGATGAF